MNKKWKVVSKDKSVDEKYIKDFRAGRISSDDNKIIRRWFNLVEDFGPGRLLKSTYWNDHPLEGEWKGYRSSSFSNSERIIYKVEEGVITVVVFRISPDHNYKK